MESHVATRAGAEGTRPPEDRYQHGPVALARLWFGLVAGPLAWTIAELLGYLLVARRCDQWRVGLGSYAVSSARWASGVLTMLALAATAAALVVAWRAYRSAEAALRREAPDEARALLESGAHDLAPHPGAAAPAWGRARFMALAGVVTSALLLLNLAYFGLMPFFVTACAEGR
jgi:hypothetical protein